MKLSGDWEKLAKKLEKLATDTPQKVGTTLKQVAEETIKEVKGQTPVDTGQLRMGWHREDGGNFKQLIFSNVEYSIFVEYGHRVRHSNKVVPGVLMLKKTIENLEPVFKDKIGSTIRAEFE